MTVDDDDNESVVGDLNAELAKSPWVRSYRLKVVLQEDNLIITGLVNSYHHKQIILHLATKCRGRRSLHIQEYIKVNGC
jgi:hypothetical protein